MDSLSDSMVFPRERRLELRINEHDERQLRKLVAYLGQAARLDLSPRRFTKSEAVRTAVNTLVNEFERNGFPDNPRGDKPFTRKRKGVA